MKKVNILLRKTERLRQRLGQQPKSSGEELIDGYICMS